jgi:hypothetical protein
MLVSGRGAVARLSMNRSVDTPQFQPRPRPARRLSDQLQLLARLHYLLAVLTAVSAVTMIPMLNYGLEVLYPTPGQPISKETSDFLRLLRMFPGVDRPEYDDALLALTLILTVSGMMTLAVAHGFVLATVGWYLARCQRYLLVFVVSIVNLTNAPFGTILSAYTISLLHKPEVKARFGRGQATAKLGPQPK